MAFLRSWECLHLRSSFPRVVQKGAVWDILTNRDVMGSGVPSAPLTSLLESNSSPVYRGEVKNHQLSPGAVTRFMDPHRVLRTGAASGTCFARVGPRNAHQVVERTSQTQAWEYSIFAFTYVQKDRKTQKGGMECYVCVV